MNLYGGGFYNENYFLMAEVWDLKLNLSATLAGMADKRRLL